MFESARLKVKRANKHIAELDALLQSFFNARPYRVFSDFDESVGAFGLRVEMTASLPAETGIVIGDVIHNLRSGLEHVASDLVAIADSDGARERSKFPMHEHRDTLIDAINKGEIKAAFPKVADAILNLVKPHKGGNDLIWLVGKLWNIDKHRLPVTSYGITSVEDIHAMDDRDNMIVGAGAIVEQGCCAGIVTSDRPITVTHYGQATFYVLFNEPGLLEGDPVVPTLAQMSKLTAEAIDIIENAFRLETAAAA